MRSRKHTCARPKESAFAFRSQSAKSGVGLNEEPDEEGEDEKGDVGARAMGLGLISRCSSVPALAVVAGLQMPLLKCLFAS